MRCRCAVSAWSALSLRCLALECAVVAPSHHGVRCPCAVSLRNALALRRHVVECAVVAPSCRGLRCGATSCCCRRHPRTSPYIFKSSPCIFKSTKILLSRRFCVTLCGCVALKHCRFVLSAHMNCSLADMSCSLADISCSFAEMSCVRADVL